MTPPNGLGAQLRGTSRRRSLTHPRLMPEGYQDRLERAVPRQLQRLVRRRFPRLGPVVAPDHAKLDGAILAAALERLPEHQRDRRSALVVDLARDLETETLVVRYVRRVG